MIDAETVWHDLERIRAEGPLVHNITNYVVMNSTANALLAVGASPVMAHAIEEVGEMAGMARALVINIGTLSAPWIEAMIKAGESARRMNIPVILDPVGCGATVFRTTTSQRLLRSLQPVVVRGNASEVMALSRGVGATKGVDSSHASEESVDSARTLAERFHCVVSVSGASDLVVGPGSLVRILNGHPMMPRVTGLGCTATALTGAFVAVNRAPLLAAAHAMTVMGIAGEIAAERAPGPGSFQIQFLDALYLLQKSDIEHRIRIDLTGL